MSKNFSLYGLPEKVEFCSKCVMSNQRPRSVVEFKSGNNLKCEDIEFSHDGHRMLFRGVQTMPAQTGLSKQHMTSIPWKYILPDQLKWAGSSETKPAYITTNVENDASGKMNRTDRLFHLLAKQGIVELFTEEDIYGQRQSVWKLNIEKYYETLV